MAAAPGVAALAFSAASTAVQGASFLSGRSAAKSQRNVDLANAELVQEQSRLRAAQAAQQSTVGFRKALASQLALAGMRGGSGSVMRQFGSESYSNYLADQENINRGMSIANIQAQNSKAQAYGNEAASNQRGLAQLTSTGLAGFNLNNLGFGGKK
jgi:hypothetical protein